MEERTPKNLKVYYGYAKLTKKVVRKKELVVIFENANHNSMKNEAYVKRKVHIVYTRTQTKAEMSDCDIYNRMFTKYGYFIDEKYGGDIERALEDNFVSDQNHVSKSKRIEIREVLRKAYFEVFGPQKGYQIALIFN